MARIKLVAPVGDIRGTMFGFVYSVWKAGVSYVRQYQSVVLNPNSPNQEVVRLQTQNFAQRWYNVLSDAQRAGWDEMAQRLATIGSDPFTSNGILQLVPAVGGVMSGMNAYIGLNVRAIKAGLAGGDDAPVGEDQPTPPLIGTPTYVPATGILSVPFTDPLTAATGFRACLWLRTRSRVFHKQERSYAATATSPIAIQTAFGALGAGIRFDAVAPQRVLLQMRTINPSGFASPGGETKELSLPLV